MRCHNLVFSGLAEAESQPGDGEGGGDEQYPHAWNMVCGRRTGYGLVSVLYYVYWRTRLAVQSSLSISSLAGLEGAGPVHSHAIESGQTGLRSLALACRACQSRQSLYSTEHD